MPSPATKNNSASVDITPFSSLLALLPRRRPEERGDGHGPQGEWRYHKRKRENHYLITFFFFNNDASKELTEPRYLLVALNPSCSDSASLQPNVRIREKEQDHWRVKSNTSSLSSVRSRKGNPESIVEKAGRETNRRQQDLPLLLLFSKNTYAYTRFIHLPVVPVSSTNYQVKQKIKQ